MRVSGKPDIRGVWEDYRAACLAPTGILAGAPGLVMSILCFTLMIRVCYLLSLLSHLSLATRLDLSHSSLKVRKRLGVVRRPGGCTRHPRARPGSRSLRRDAIHPLPQRRQPRARRRPRPRRRGRRARRPLRRGHPREPLPVHLRRAPVHVGHG